MLSRYCARNLKDILRWPGMDHRWTVSITWTRPGGQEAIDTRQCESTGCFHTKASDSRVFLGRTSLRCFAVLSLPNNAVGIA